MSNEKELLKGNTPTLVLAVLRDGPLHGYGIAREIERRSAEALSCKEGTLYPVLHSLERDGLIQGEWRRDKGERSRKEYTLTTSGAAALEERARSWEQFAAAVGRVLGGNQNEDDLAPRRSPRGRAAGPGGPLIDPA